MDGRRASLEACLRRRFEEVLEVGLVLVEPFLGLGMVGVFRRQIYQLILEGQFLLFDGKIYFPQVFAARTGDKDMRHVGLHRVKLVMSDVAAEDEMDFRDGLGEPSLFILFHMRQSNDHLAIFLFQFGDDFFCSIDKVGQVEFLFFSRRPPQRKPSGNQSQKTHLDPLNLFDDVGFEDRFIRLAIHEIRGQKGKFRLLTHLDDISHAE